MSKNLIPYNFSETENIYGARRTDLIKRNAVKRDFLVICSTYGCALKLIQNVAIIYCLPKLPNDVWLPDGQGMTMERPLFPASRVVRMVEIYSSNLR